MENILKSIVPNKIEQKEVHTKVKEFLTKLNLLSAIPGGSFAKGTWLKGNHDIDIYVKYKTDKAISDKLEKSLKKFKPTRVHGSRDYFQLTYKGLQFEIIPVVEIKHAKEAKNITDLSQLHVKYVKKHTTKTIQDQIRLAKYFFKVHNLYGAETHIRGFSGYCIELLVIYYGSFKGLIKAVRRWREKVILDPAHHYKNKQQITLMINKARQLAPLILIDPVHLERNAAAALTIKKFNDLIELANSRHVSFISKPFSLDALKGFHVLRIEPVDGKRDVVGAKLVKVMEYIKQRSDSEGFLTKESGWYWGEIAYLYFKTTAHLTPTKDQVGPFVHQKEHIVAFKRKHIHTFVKGDRVYAKVSRAHLHAEDFFNHIIKDPYITERVKTIHYTRA